MRFFIKNANTSISLSLTALRIVGFWAPDGLNKDQALLYKLYALFFFMFFLGIYIIIQVVDLFMIWGDLPLMTGTAFLLFTNLAQAAKILNILQRRRFIKQIIDDADRALAGVVGEEAKAIVGSCNRETIVQQGFYFFITLFTCLGWASGAEKNQLPMRAWYPYDSSKSPAFELTYLHQVAALCTVATLNVGKDTLVTSLIAQCRCRLQLLGLALRTMCRNLEVDRTKLMLTPHQELIVWTRLRSCVNEHQVVLTAVEELQHCFSSATFAQFTVSLIIICVTAFQLISQTSNLVRLLPMATYLFNMCFQVFIYCYQGTHLVEEGSEIAGATYECPWYNCSPRLRRALLIVMVRSRRPATISAGGFATLSLATFMAIIKASYSLFTLLQQVVDK